MANLKGELFIFPLFVVHLRIVFGGRTWAIERRGCGELTGVLM